MNLVALAPRGFEDVLSEELGSRLVHRHGRLFEFKGDAPVSWAQNLWRQPCYFRFESIGQAAKHLRSIQRNWWHHPTNCHRRAALIQAELPPIRRKRFNFPGRVPESPLGSWTLLDEHTMLYSKECSSPFPDGEVEFNENKLDPPSRAYLKLWETFTLEGSMPSPGQTVLDLGSSPGGWTWVLDQIGCVVISVDKAPLSCKTRFSSRVKYISESAFALDPQNIGKIDWLFSDVICYPRRLLDLVGRWQSHTTRMVCTIKFQGQTDHSTVAEFLQIAGSKVRHLSCNKHELTWIL